MKPFSLEICLKRSTIFYKKASPKTIKLRANILAGKASKVPPLGSLLGTYGINAEVFCTQFNSLSAMFSNVLLAVNITILPTKTFLLQLKLPSFYNLYTMLLKKKTFKRNRRLKTPAQILILLVLYKIYLVTNRTKKFFIQATKTMRLYDWQDLGRKPKVKFFKHKRKA